MSVWNEKREKKRKKEKYKNVKFNKRWGEIVYSAKLEQRGMTQRRAYTNARAAREHTHGHMRHARTVSEERKGKKTWPERKKDWRE